MVLNCTISRACQRAYEIFEWQIATVQGDQISQLQIRDTSLMCREDRGGGGKKVTEDRLLQLLSKLTDS